MRFFVEETCFRNRVSGRAVNDVCRTLSDVGSAQVQVLHHDARRAAARYKLLSWKLNGISNLSHLLEHLPRRISHHACLIYTPVRRVALRFCYCCSYPHAAHPFG